MHRQGQVRNSDRASKSDVNLSVFTPKDGIVPSDIEARRRIAEKHSGKDVEAKFEKYKERMEVLTRKAQKFRELVAIRYQTLPLHKLLEKGKKFQKKYEFTDDEFHIFINLALNDRENRTNDARYNASPLGKLLGGPNDFGPISKMDVPSNELDVIQDIFKLYAESRDLYSNVNLQAMSYEDCSNLATHGQIDLSRPHSFASVHPVVVALFLPQFEVLESHMIRANLGHIVNCRYYGVQIKSIPDWEVYWDIRTDPNAFLCASFNDSPLKDLRNRVRLQIELWKQILELRAGRYFSDTFINFNNAIDACKNNILQDVEISFMRDEGTVLKKLFGAFSFRPTTIQVLPMLGHPSVGMTGNYSLGTMAINPAKVTAIPVVNISLPFNDQGGDFRIESALENYTWFVENHQLVPRITQVACSRGLISFYVNRRYQKSNMDVGTSGTYFTMLPLGSANEEINRTSLNVTGGDRFLNLICNGRRPNNEPIESDRVRDPTDDNKSNPRAKAFPNYSLRSVVALKTQKVNKASNDENSPFIITGCVSYVYQPMGKLTYTGEDGKKTFSVENQNGNLLCYDPLAATLLKSNSAFETDANKKSNVIRVVNAGDEDVQINTKGTIYIYQALPTNSDTETRFIMN
jgi:hypothetical protein